MYWGFRKLGGTLFLVAILGAKNLGVSENEGVPYLGVLIIRILLFRLRHEGALYSQTPILGFLV